MNINFFILLDHSSDQRLFNNEDNDPIVVQDDIPEIPAEFIPEIPAEAIPEIPAEGKNGQITTCTLGVGGVGFGELSSVEWLR